MIKHELKETIIQLNLTRKCQMNCMHCYMTPQVRKKDEYMSIQEIKEYMDKILEWYEKSNFEILSLNLIGGEILNLSSDYLTQIIDLLNDYKTKFSKPIIIKTTTSLLVNNIFEYSYFIKNIDFIGTSWDMNINRFKNFYEDRWQENLNYVRSLNNNIGLNITITKFILGKEKEILDYSKNLKVKNLAFMSLIGKRNETIELMPTFKQTSEFLINLYEIIKKDDYFDLNNVSPFSTMIDAIKNNKLDEGNVCEILNSFNIETSGNIYLCDGEYDGGKNNETFIGNFRSYRNVNDMINSKNFKDVYFKKLSLPLECLKCEFIKQCYGGCRINMGIKEKHDGECWNFKNLWKHLKQDIENKVI